MKTSAFATEILRLVFNGSAIPGLAENSSLPAAHLYVSLHTGAPIFAQIDQETSYAGYARAKVVRSAAGWVVTGNTAKNAGVIEFAECSGVTISHVGIGADAKGEGRLMYVAALASPVKINVGHLPRFAPGAILVIEETL